MKCVGDTKKVNNKTVFICDFCGLGYSDEDTAEKCEKWCKVNGTCSLEITRKAIYFPDPFKNFKKNQQKTYK